MAKDGYRKRKRKPASPPPSPPHQIALRMFYLANYKVLFCFEASEDEKKTQKTRIGELQRLVNIWQDFRDAILEPYGSYMTGLYSKYRYVDISINNIFGNCHDLLGYLADQMREKWGSKPNLADLAVFGVLRPIRYLRSGKDMVEQIRIGEWYSRMGWRVFKDKGIDLWLQSNMGRLTISKGHEQT